MQKGDDAYFDLVDAFEKFDTVTERVAKFESVHSWDRYSVLDGTTGRGQFFSPMLKIIHLISDMSLRFGSFDTIFSAEVYLEFA